MVLITHVSSPPFKRRRRSLASTCVCISLILVSLCKFKLRMRTTCQSCNSKTRKAQQQMFSFRAAPLLIRCPHDHVYNVTVLQQTNERGSTRRHHRHHHHSPAPLTNDNKNHNDTDDEECIPMASWQTQHYVSCNVFHEVNLLQSLREFETIKIVGSGFYRSVWSLQDATNTPIALKTLNLKTKHSDIHTQVGYQVDFIPSTIKQQRTDAIVMDELQTSPYISDIYGYCSTSALTEFSGEGNLHSNLKEKRHTKYELLQMAHSVARAVADVHHPTPTQQNRATIVHADLNPNQFLKFGETYKLNDFNRAQLIYRNTTSDKPCGIQTHMNWRATHQSPEEHSQEFQNEKVDVFTMGLVLYKIWLDQSLYPKMSPQRRRDFIIKGGHPKIPNLDSEHALDIVMPTVLRNCWKTNPKERASAQEIADLLSSALQEV